MNNRNNLYRQQFHNFPFKEGDIIQCNNAAYVILGFSSIDQLEFEVVYMEEKQYGEMITYENIFYTSAHDFRKYKKDIKLLGKVDDVELYLTKLRLIGVLLKEDEIYTRKQMKEQNERKKRKLPVIFCYLCFSIVASLVFLIWDYRLCIFCFAICIINWVFEKYIKGLLCSPF